MLKTERLIIPPFEIGDAATTYRLVYVDPAVRDPSMPSAPRTRAPVP
jgi:hypothetical protein